MKNNHSSNDSHVIILKLHVYQVAAIKCRKKCTCFVPNMSTCSSVNQFYRYFTNKKNGCTEMFHIHL